MDAVSATFVTTMLKAFDDVGEAFAGTVREHPTNASSPASTLSLMAQAIVSLGNNAFDYISGYDTFWHTAVFRADIEYRPDEESRVLDAYREWSENARRMIDILTNLDASDQPVPGLNQLRANLSRAEGVLTDDSEFFEGESLDRLAGQAIAALERGETEEFTEMGQ